MQTALQDDGPKMMAPLGCHDCVQVSKLEFRDYCRSLKAEYGSDPREEE